MHFFAPIRPYPEYRPSELEYVGDIPFHWSVARADSFLDFEKVQIDPSTLKDEILFHYSIPAIQQTGDGVLEPAAAIDSAKLRILGVRLLVSKLNPRKGVVLVADQKRGVTTVCSSEFVPLRCTRCHDRWAFYLYSAETTRQNLSRIVRSATRSHQRAEISDITKMWHPVPPLEEQKTIAAFLDKETERVEALVAKKERLIQVLEEKRAALITQAVTRGFDPSVPMRESSVEWLGKIPAHWEIKPLKAVSRLQTGLTLGKRYEGKLTTRPYLRVANVQDGYLELDNIAEVELLEQDVSRYELQDGDVLMTEGGDFDKLGRGSVWTDAIPGCLHQNHVFAVRPRLDTLRSRFLALVMSSGYGRAYFTATSKQSTNLASTNSNKLRNFPLGVPSVAEQDRILLEFDQTTSRIDALVAKVRSAIDRLRERRAALISAAVTGKIDVRTI
jgi:type I restriction enzyme S subunit